MSSIEQAMNDMRQYTDVMNNYVSVLRSLSDKSKLNILAEQRKFSVELLDNLQIFYVGNMTEMLIPEYIDSIEALGMIASNKKPVFQDRFVIPIKDNKGNVLNMVGYRRDADERYIFGNGRYYDRKNTLWGLERIELAYELGYAFVTEGITDAMSLRQLGYENSFAMCGTHKSDVILAQLNRCRYGVIALRDRDSAGVKASKEWKFLRSLMLNVRAGFKDVDQMRTDSQENEDCLREYLDLAVNWVKQVEHEGKQRVCEEATMM